ncbi:MAG: hypothetical protein JNK35_12020 [Phycisphaerae bacterium]|nr:hypothetical protein [Phycisphaerae bacterium]
MNICVKASALSCAILAGAALATTPAPGASVAAPAAARAGEPDMGKLLADKSAAMVTVKFVSKISMQGRDDFERETETTGVMIDGKGLVLCTSMQMGGVPAQYKGMVTVTPTNIKVLVGDDTEGVSAKVITRDTDLDLAWVRIDKAPEKPYTFVDFAAGSKAEVKVGDQLLMVDRLGKFFDRAPLVGEMRVGAILKKPRTLYYPSGVMNRYGVPIFSGDLKAVGFAVLQSPSAEDEAADSDGSGGRDQLVVLPAAEVVSATERALKTAAEGAEGEASKDDAKKDAAPAGK